MATESTLTLRPVPSTDRDENAPILATKVVIGDVVVASYSDAADETYPTWNGYLEVAQATASELLGWENGPGHVAIGDLMRESAAADDDEMVALCRKALAGDDDAFAKCADAVLDAKLAALD